MPIIQVMMRVTKQQLDNIINGSSELKGLLINSITKRTEKHIPILAATMAKESVVQFAISFAAVGAAVGAAFGCIKLYQFFTRKRVEVFKARLDKYIRAINEESLTEDMVDELLSALDAITKKKNSAKIQFSAEEMQALISCLTHYTKELSRANSFSPGIPALPEGDKNLLAVAQLRQNLLIQKKIFQGAKA